MGRRTRHGLPNATTSAGISRVTTLPAPMTVLSPMLTPETITVPAPIQAVLSYMHRGVVLVFFKPQLREDRVPRDSNGHVRTEHRVVADVYMRVIDQRQPEIGVNAVARNERASRPNSRAAAVLYSIARLSRQTFREAFFRAFRIPTARHIVVIQQFKAFLLLCHYIVVAGQIKLARVKLVDHCHFIFPLF